MKLPSSEFILYPSPISRLASGVVHHAPAMLYTVRELSNISAAIIGIVSPIPMEHSFSKLSYIFIPFL